MSRDVSGNYTLPLPNVISNDLITTTWANTTLADIAAEITNSIPRNGSAPLTGALRMTDGGVGAPALSFNSEPTTGVYRSGAGEFSVATLGAQRLVVSGSGNVGVGISNPGTKLDVVGQIRSKNASGDAGGLRMWSDVSGNGNLFEYFNAALIFGTNDTERMRIDSSGNLLVGIASGNGTRLRVDSAAAPWFTFGASGAAASYGQFFRGGTSTIGGYIGFDGGALLGTGTGTGFTVRSEADLILMSSATERVRIDSVGNVGIGRAATYALDVYRSSGNVLISALSGSASGVGAGFRMGNATKQYQIGVSPGLGTSDDWTLYDESAATVRQVVTGVGNFGFNTSPSGANYHFKGSAVNIAKFETTTARGSGSIVLGLFDPSGTKGYFGYGSANDTLQIYNGLGGIDFYANGTGPTVGIAANGVLTLSRGGVGLSQSVSLSGGVVEWDLINTSNTANSQSSIFMQVAGASAGDNFIRMNINAVTDWTFGVDNSDSDAFVFAASSSLGSGNILKLGTGSVVDISGGSGKLTMAGNITRFQSAEQAISTTNFSTIVVSHGGPRTPDVLALVLRCKTAELGYSVGDEVEITAHNHTMNDRAYALWSSATQVGSMWVQGITVAPSVNHKSTGTITTVTAANWKLVFKCLWL